VAASVAVLVLGVLVPYLATRRDSSPDSAFQEIAPSAPPAVGRQVPSLVRMRPAWGRAGQEGETFARPARLGRDDYLNLYLTASEPGQLYVFQVLPDGTTEFQPPDHRDTDRACSGLAGEAGRELLFGTYQLDDPPGRYCFVVILAREPIPGICGHVEEHLAPSAAERGVGTAVGEVLAAYKHPARIIGHAHFSYSVGGE
jgi:hypothetical protein